MAFLAFLLFDNIAKRSLLGKSRLVWHFRYFPSFLCLYKSKKVSCRFTDGVGELGNVARHKRPETWEDIINCPRIREIPILNQCLNFFSTSDTIQLSVPH